MEKPFSLTNGKEDAITSAIAVAGNDVYVTGMSITEPITQQNIGKMVPCITYHRQNHGKSHGDCIDF